MDCIVHRVTKSQTRLNNFYFTSLFRLIFTSPLCRYPVFLYPVFQMDEFQILISTLQSIKHQDNISYSLPNITCFNVYMHVKISIFQTTFIIFFSEPASSPLFLPMMSPSPPHLSDLKTKL